MRLREILYTVALGLKLVPPPPSIVDHPTLAKAREAEEHLRRQAVVIRRGFRTGELAKLQQYLQSINQ